MILDGGEIPVPGHATSKDWSGTTPGTTRYPGRNHPRLGEWLVANFCPPGGSCADPMIGTGGLWLNLDQTHELHGCDVSEQAIRLAAGNVHPATLEVANAETWTPACKHVNFVAFSPMYPQAHSAGRSAHQIEMRERQGLHAMQEFKHPFPDLMKVYQQVRTYCTGVMCVIVRNRIVRGEETNWVYEQASLMFRAGWVHQQLWWRNLERPTGYQQWKLARDPRTPWIQKEYVIAAR